MEVFGEKTITETPFLQDDKRPGFIAIDPAFRLSRERGEKSLEEMWSQKNFQKLVKNLRKPKKKEVLKKEMVQFLSSFNATER